MSAEPGDLPAAAENPTRSRGHFKIYMGYAAGVGKTYQMLDDGQELLAQGVDVVIGYFETHGRKDTIARAVGLETLPRKKLAYRGATFEEMDTEAILARRPEVCLVDELAHTNVPGSERVKRWQDVQILLDAGLSVTSTMNVQHLESLNDQIRQITGVRVRETVPDWVVNEADEVIMVDVTPRALLNRFRRGVVYPVEKAQRAMDHFFTEANLGALREIALRQTAHEVEDRLEHSEPEPSETSQAVFSDETARTGHHGRVMICLSGHPGAAATLIRRGKRVADFLQADCLAVYVVPDPSWNHAPAEKRAAVESLMTLAENLHIETKILHGKDVARTLVDFARSRGVTQMFLGRSPKRGWRHRLRGNIVDRVVRLAPDLQITIVA